MRPDSVADEGPNLGEQMKLGEGLRQGMEVSHVLLCRCEEVSQAEIDAALALGLRSLDEIKKCTRAGMGLCQGRTCGHLLVQYVAQAMGCSPADISPGRVRPPVRLVEMEAWAREGDDEPELNSAGA